MTTGSTCIEAMPIAWSPWENCKTSTCLTHLLPSTFVHVHKDDETYISCINHLLQLNTMAQCAPAKTHSAWLGKADATLEVQQRGQKLCVLLPSGHLYHLNGRSHLYGCDTNYVVVLSHTQNTHFPENGCYTTFILIDSFLEASVC